MSEIAGSTKNKAEIITAARNEAERINHSSSEVLKWLTVYQKTVPVKTKKSGGIIPPDCKGS
jgi:hypothetical protein